MVGFCLVSLSNKLRGRGPGPHPKKDLLIWACLKIGNPLEWFPPKKNRQTPHFAVLWPGLLKLVEEILLSTTVPRQCVVPVLARKSSTTQHEEFDLMVSDWWLASFGSIMSYVHGHQVKIYNSFGGYHGMMIQLLIREWAREPRDPTSRAVHLFT